NSYGRVAFRRCAISQFTIVIVSPGPHGPVLLDGNTVILTPRNSEDIRQAAHLNRRMTLHRCAISQLAKPVVTPRPDGSVVLNGKIVIGHIDGTAASNRHDIGEATHLNRYVAIRHCAISQFT